MGGLVVKQVSDNLYVIDKIFLDINDFHSSRHIFLAKTTRSILALSHLSARYYFWLHHTEDQTWRKY